MWDGAIADRRRLDREVKTRISHVSLEGGLSGENITRNRGDLMLLLKHHSKGGQSAEASSKTAPAAAGSKSSGNCVSAL